MTKPTQKDRRERKKQKHNAFDNHTETNNTNHEEQQNISKTII